MKVVQVTPGLLPIPPNGWGAVEKIIWMYHLNTIWSGHDSEIKYLDDVNSSSDIVHIHVANLAIMAYQRGIKYVFSMHDHHAFLYGKDSSVYKENLGAIEHSEISFVPAKFLIPYFNNHHKLKYLEHGVDNEFFTPGIQPINHKLLCVANNGYANNQKYDRKGFSYAIEAAKILNLPITIAGPKNNENYFNSVDINYDKLTIRYDLTEDELVKLYQDHTIFLHPSELEAGHPNLTLLEAMSCGLPVVGTYEPGNELPGLFRIERDVEQVVNGIKSVMLDYNAYRIKAITCAQDHSFAKITEKLISEYDKIINKKEDKMKDRLIDIYENTPMNKESIINNIKENEIIYSFINGAKVEILGNQQKRYKVQFIDSDANRIVYENEMNNNCWCETSIQYHVNWLINVYEGDNLISQHKFNPTNKNIYIALESKAIGDTIAWFPILDEYRKKWNCNLVVSTFHNKWFKDTYPEIKFIEPGHTTYDLYAMFRIGWYYDGDKINYNMNKNDFRLSSLQQTTTDILNLPPMEIRPKLSLTKKRTDIDGKYVIIAPHASAHAKYWNHPGGWQTLVHHINSLGYKVVMITQEKLGDAWQDSKIGGKLINVVDKTGDLPIADRMADILNAELFIGVSSGLSWISWALNTKTIVISGFTDKHTEFTDCIRISTTEKNACSGCCSRYKLDAGDWDWCPEHKGTDRMFECTKTIKPEQIITEIDKILA
jgi:autotransporter strand-loop-strand O-heptosyltransferase